MMPTCGNAERRRTPVGGAHEQRCVLQGPQPPGQAKCKEYVSGACSFCTSDSIMTNFLVFDMLS
jgi:hypothetical protein